VSIRGDEIGVLLDIVREDQADVPGKKRLAAELSLELKLFDGGLAGGPRGSKAKDHRGQKSPFP
jgi:hypothetical protein